MDVSQIKFETLEELETKAAQKLLRKTMERQAKDIKDKTENKLNNILEGNTF